MKKPQTKLHNLDVEKDYYYLLRVGLLHTNGAEKNQHL